MNSIHSRKRLHNMHISEAGLKMMVLKFNSLMHRGHFENLKTI